MVGRRWNLRAERRIPLRVSLATSADTSAPGVGLVDPHSRRAPGARKTTKTSLGDAALCLKMCHESRRSDGSDFVRATPTNGFEAFNQTVINKPVKGRVQSPRRKVNTSEIFNILCQRVTVLGSVSETRKHQRGRSGVAAQCGKFVWHI